MKTAFTLSLALAFFSLNAQVSVKSFGAKGDGTTNDAAAIQKALNSGNSQVYFEAGKTYVTGSVLFVPSNVTVTGNGATLKPNSSFPTYNHPVIGTYSKPSTYNQTGISISVKKGSSTFSFSKASSLSVGSIVLLEGPVYKTYGDGTYSYGWYASIKAISGTTVTLSVPSTDTYTATEITQYVTSKNIHIKGINVNLKGRKTGYGVGLAHSIGSSIESCFVESDPTSTSAPVGISAAGLNLTISKNKVRNIRLSSSIGYGINVSGHNITVSGNDIAVARHCITSAQRNYISTGILISKNTVSCGPGGAPIDFHGNTYGTIDGNTVYSTTPNIVGIMVRNSNTTVSNNIINVNNVAGKSVYGVGLSENGYANINIIKNKFYFKGTTGTVASVADFSVSGTITNLNIYGNYCQAGVRLDAALGTGVHIDSNTFVGNTVYNPTIIIATDNLKEYYIEKNTFTNNFDDRFNYTISITSEAKGSGYIRNNVVRCTNGANKNPQFRLNGIRNVLENNKFYTQYTHPLIDYTTNKENWLSSSSTNKWINNDNKTTVITYKEMPKATSWFLGRVIAYTDGSGNTAQYKCVQSGTSYVWKKQTTTT